MTTSMTGTAHWYAVHTETGREAYARDHLVNQSFEVFLPQHDHTVRHARRLSVKRGAFFPGYLFVRLDLKVQRWRAINGTRGVKHVVGAGDRPLPVPEGIVEWLQGMADDAGVIAYGSGLKRGDTVRLLDTPFAECVGLVSGPSGGERVRVLVDLLNARVPMIVRRDSVAPVTENGVRARPARAIGEGCGITGAPVRA